jgi:predicted Zn-dependent protease
MVTPLQPPESHVLSAAEGWLELGNPAEAAAELRDLEADWGDHPSVLDLKWQIHAHQMEWETCVALADALVRSHPEIPSGWIHRSYALHELQRTAAARDQLLPAVAQFPDEIILPYNLACYECRLGNLPAARQWLQTVFARSSTTTWREAALGDPDLVTLWPEIPTL